jgi:hypothetical protein
MNVETTWCTCLFNLFYLGNAENSSPCPPCAGAKVLLHLQTKECTNSCRPEVVDFPDAIPCCSWDISNVHITSSYITRVLSKTCHFYIYIYCTNCIYSLYILIVYSIIFYIYIFYILHPTSGPRSQRIPFTPTSRFSSDSSLPGALGSYPAVSAGLVHRCHLHHCLQNIGEVPWGPMDVMDDGRWWTGQAVKPTSTGPFNPKSFQHLPPLNMADWNARATIEAWVPHEPDIKKDQKGGPSGPRPPVSHIELLPRETATGNIILETWCMGLFTGSGCTSLKVGVANGERAIN